MQVADTKTTTFNILLPTDFGECADNACRYALKFIQESDANITFVNMFESSGGDYSEYQNVSKAHEELLQKEVLKCKEHIEENHSVEYVLLNGKIDYMPEGVLKEYDIDLVIMGTHGLPKGKDFDQWSHTSFLMSRLDYNFLIIPDGHLFKKPRKLLFATDLKTIGGKWDLSMLQKVVEKYEPDVHVVLVSLNGDDLTSEQKERKQEIENKFSKYNFTFHQIDDEDVLDGIRKLKNSEDIDFVCAVAKHRTFIDRITHFSVTKKLAEHNNTPLLILKSH